MFTFPTRIFCRTVPCFAIDCPCASYEGFNVKRQQCTCVLTGLVETFIIYWNWNRFASSFNFASAVTSGCNLLLGTVYPKKYAHGFVVLCFVVVMQSFIMNPREIFIHIHQGCFAGTGAIVRLPQCQWSKPGGYGKISHCITTTKHSKAKTVCIFLGIYCTFHELIMDRKLTYENVNSQQKK